MKIELNRLCEIYLNQRKDDLCHVGYIINSNEDNIVVEQYNYCGIFEGLYFIRIHDLYKITYKSKYIEKMNALIGSRHVLDESYSKLSTIREALDFAIKQNRIVSTFKKRGSFIYDIIPTSIDDECLIGKGIRLYGNEYGEVKIKLSDLVFITILEIDASLEETLNMKLNNKDLFRYWLDKKDNILIKRALTDNSCKNVDHELLDKDTNCGLSTLGDSVLRMCLTEILYEMNVSDISEERKKYESNKFLVEVVAKYYDLVSCIDIDKENSNDMIVKDYKYNDKTQKGKYIADAVEAIIGAIYLETNNIKNIKDLVLMWIELEKKIINKNNNIK